MGHPGHTLVSNAICGLWALENERRRAARGPVKTGTAASKSALFPEIAMRSRHDHGPLRLGHGKTPTSRPPSLSCR